MMDCSTREIKAYGRLMLPTRTACSGDLANYDLIHNKKAVLFAEVSYCRDHYSSCGDCDPYRCPNLHYIDSATTSFTAGSSVVSNCSIPFLRVTVLEGHPEQEPRSCTVTTPS